MNVGKAIYYLLANNANVSAITTRIYPEIAPQDAAAPYIVYTISNVSPDDTHDGPATIDEVRMEITCVADTYDVAGDLASKARVALDRVYGTYNTVNVESIQFQDVQIQVRDTPRQYGQELTFIVRVKRDDVQIATGSPIEDITLGRLADVDTAGATDDQVLTYDAATDSWGPEDASTVAGLDDLTDVTIDTPANNQALVYNSAAGEWRNDQLSLTQLEGISSELGDAIDRQALVYDEASNQWIADGVGQVVIPVRNPSRDDSIAVGTVLKATGSQGDRILVAPFQPTDDPKLLVGIASEVIGTGADGHAQVYGELRKIDTDDFEVGDILYPQADGVLGTTENLFPFAIVTRKHQNTGRIFVRMWVPGKGYHNRYRTEASAEMFVGVGAEVELYYTATADGDGFVTQDLTAAVAEGNVEERVLRYKSGAFGDSGTTSGYTNAGLATDATYAEMLTAFNNLIKTESPPLTIYATRTEVSARSGLLADYPGAAAAYSLRLLDSDYTGDAIRVRRASDNTEQDIGFDGNGDLDTSALATFCAGTDGFVKTWYDQANSNDATQATTASQPKVYDSVTGVVTENGNPAVDFDGSNDVLSKSTELATPDNLSVVSVFNLTTRTNSQRIYHVRNAADNITMAADLTTGIAFRSLSNDTAYNGPFSDISAQSLFFHIDSDTLYKNANLVTTKYSGSLGFTGVSGIHLGARANGNNHASVRLQEFLLYPSSQSTNRTGIETNINDNYLIHSQSPTGLLADYPGAAAAYSLRQLISTAQLAIAVRRDSDDAVLGIGFVNGELDTTTLATFCSGANGFVAVWFDQSGSGNHATQTTTANQPKVYDSAAGVVTENGKAAVAYTSGTGVMLQSANFASPYSQPTTLIAIGASGGTGGEFMISGGNSSSLSQAFATRTTTFQIFSGTQVNTSTAIDADQHVWTVVFDDPSSNAWQDGAQVVTNQSSGTSTMSRMTLFNLAYSPTLPWEGVIQEVIFYSTDQSANRTGIETNINDFYTIF